jgi:hypothetical protein
LEVDVKREKESVEEQQNSPRVLAAEPGIFRMTGSPATFWLTASFAPQWYEDALAEAQAGGDFRHRRREILFAVCAAESYLLEWVRDEVLSRNFTKLNKYFPPGARRGVAEKWKAVLKELERDCLIPRSPDLSTIVWQDFMTLLEYRDGIVHACMSRPETHGLPDDEQPRPSKNDRDNLVPGWATRIVARLITHLHSAVGTQTPEWLAESDGA